MGIVVGNVAYSPDSVADYTMMLMLMAVRNAKSIMRSVEKHDFRLDSVRGKVLSDMTVGVVGTGRIGKAVIERLRGFGCHVLAYDRSQKIEANYEKEKVSPGLIKRPFSVFAASFRLNTLFF